MNADLHAAYTLIGEYDCGSIAPGSPITVDQARLLHLLAADLDVPIQSVSLEALVSRVAQANTRWNHRTQETVSRFYSLRDAGSQSEAEAERETFMRQCPSVWYCGIVSAL
jgi:hypothetical protein